MIFEWDDAKDRANQRNHNVSFRVATFAFDDPPHISKPDSIHDDGELRWKTLGHSSPSLLLLVVHTLLEEDGMEELVRIISARAATPAERNDYEDG